MTDTRVRGAREGFTLIEILVAIAIVAILTMVVAPNLLKYVTEGGETATKASMRALKTAINQFSYKMGDPPISLRDLVRKPKEEKFAKKWTGSYLDSKDVPPDGWGTPFKYENKGKEGHPYELYSYGPKGKGGPKDEWISVWDL